MNIVNARVNQKILWPLAVLALLLVGGGAFLAGREAGDPDRGEGRSERETEAREGAGKGLKTPDKDEEKDRDDHDRKDVERGKPAEPDEKDADQHIKLTLAAQRGAGIRVEP